MRTRRLKINIKDCFKLLLIFLAMSLVWQSDYETKQYESLTYSPNFEEGIASLVK